MRTVKAIGFCRRGQFALAFVRDGRRVIVEIPNGLWMARRMRERELEIGGPPPRPYCASQVAELAGKMVEQRLAGAGHAPVAVPADMAPSAVCAAAKIAERVFDLRSRSTDFSPANFALATTVLFGAAWGALNPARGGRLKHVRRSS